MSQGHTYCVGLLDYSKEDDFVAPEFSDVNQAVRVARRRSRLDRYVAWAVFHEHEVEAIFFGGEMFVPAAALHRTRDMLLSFAASLTLADHLGDVYGDVLFVAEREGIELSDEPEDWPRDFGRLGIKTLYGTDLGVDDDE